jgi:hypothetical protein
MTESVARRQKQRCAACCAHQSVTANHRHRPLLTQILPGERHATPEPARCSVLWPRVLTSRDLDQKIERGRKGIRSIYPLVYVCLLAYGLKSLPIWAKGMSCSLQRHHPKPMMSLPSPCPRLIQKLMQPLQGRWAAQLKQSTFRDPAHGLSLHLHAFSNLVILPFPVIHEPIAQANHQALAW